MLAAIATPVLRIAESRRTRLIASSELGALLFGQLHPDHQGFFDEHYGQHSRVELRDLPHYVFWREHECEHPDRGFYYDYLARSWKYYYDETRNTHENRLARIASFVQLMKEIKSQGVLKGLSIVTAPDGRKILLDGNHRASIAYALGLDAPYTEVPLRRELFDIVANDDEFYGTKNRNRPYQSIFYKERELLKGRRRDIIERFRKLDVAGDIRGKSVLDLGSNIAVNAMTAWHFGARSVTAMEYSPRIAAAALRLSTVLDARIDLIVQDLGAPVSIDRKFDTVFCFSLYAHVRDKSMLEQNIANLTGGTLYFEGHENTSQADYGHIFRHFRNIEPLGFNRDGIHSSNSTRPFFRCTR